jgi:hypothetical protein
MRLLFCLQKLLDLKEGRERGAELNNLQGRKGEGEKRPLSEHVITRVEVVVFAGNEALPRH